MLSDMEIFCEDFCYCEEFSFSVKDIFRYLLCYMKCIFLWIFLVICYSDLLFVW